MLESMSAVASVQTPPRRPTASPKAAALRAARMCYDHLAGRLAVAIADAFVEHGFLHLDDEAGELTEDGFRRFAEVGIDIPKQGRRAFCRPCLDWTERRHHIAGAVGAALARHALAERWIERQRDTRALAITDKGRTAFSQQLGVETPVP
jgi:hypothetical protein